jgi:hypothetical protein
MKYYKDINNNVYAYEEDGSQDHLIGDKVVMTADEIEAHINPPVTPEQLKATKIAEAKAYLASTDYMMTADYDKDTTEVRILRQQARETIRAGV